MKNSVQCPKCDARNIYKIPGSAMNTSQLIPLNKWSTSSAILDRYICGSCGYTEEFVKLDKKFQKWAEKSLEKLSHRNDEFL